MKITRLGALTCRASLSPGFTLLGFPGMWGLNHTVTAATSDVVKSITPRAVWVYDRKRRLTVTDPHGTACLTFPGCRRLYPKGLF